MHSRSQSAQSYSTFATGSILVWEVEASKDSSASVIALEMGELADAHALGSWSITRYGLRLNKFYFDLVVKREVSCAEIKLIFGTTPRDY